MVTDTIGFAIDPLGSVLTAGVGWLLEHISFLREPLDALLIGDETLGRFRGNIRRLLILRRARRSLPRSVR